MNRQQILHEQAALIQKHEQKEITPREYVSEMTRLRSELSMAEKKICDDYDRVVLENKILKEKSLSAIELNETMLPTSYLKISERFPHLTMKEIIEFDKKVRDNGGSIKVHGGVFKVSTRTNHLSTHISYNQPSYAAWTCCHNVALCCDSGKEMWVWPCNNVVKPPLNYTLSKYTLSDAPNLVNRNPIGSCDKPVIFYLKDELQDIKKIEVSKVLTAISSNITLLESDIQEYSAKNDKLKELQKTLDCLV